MTTCGIDEAGRGHIIGNLVISGVVTTPEQEAHLASIGVKDSKLLTPKKREALFDQVKNAVSSYKIVSVTPQEIDAALADPSKNLNWLEADHSAAILNELKAARSVLDCPSPNISAYTAYVRARLVITTELICEHKADQHYLSAAAASILAKVTRDRHVEALKKEIGKDFGSGYPSDPLTKQFLDEYWRTHPRIFRTSWAGYRDKLEGRQQSLFDY